MPSTKKKKFQAIKASTRDYKGIVHEGRQYRFRGDDTFIIEDEGLARELDSQYGKKGNQTLAIAPYNDHETRELGHTYTFGALTSQRARDNFDHIFRKKGRKKNASKKRKIQGRNGQGKKDQDRHS